MYQTEQMAALSHQKKTVKKTLGSFQQVILAENSPTLTYASAYETNPTNNRGAREHQQKKITLFFLSLISALGTGSAFNCLMLHTFTPSSLPRALQKSLSAHNVLIVPCSSGVPQTESGTYSLLLLLKA